jgi:hypothetical protein
MAHNTSTIDRDLEMWRTVAHARSDHDALAAIDAAQEHVHRAYAILLSAFGTEVARQVSDPDGRLPEDHGHERTLVSVAHHDAELARRYETR